MKTAEWMCTSCGVTNRKIVRDNEKRTEDRCFTCRKKHVVEEDDRPVRWRATLKS